MTSVVFLVRGVIRPGELTAILGGR